MSDTTCQTKASVYDSDSTTKLPFFGKVQAVALSNA